MIVDDIMFSDYNWISMFSGVVDEVEEEVVMVEEAAVMVEEVEDHLLEEQTTEWLLQVRKCQF